MAPRSILKQTSSPRNAPSLAHALPYPPQQPQVHFPPTPSLTQTHYTHDGQTYDRAPIVVAPNECALPERGCPGRTYECKSAKVLKSGKHPHPRAAEASADGRIPYFGPSQAYSPSRGPPALVPDISSESDDSDGVVSPPPEYSIVCGAGTAGQHYAHAIRIASPSQEQLDKALAFLPHAPSSPPKQDSSQKRDKDRKRRSDNVRFKSEDGARSFAASSLDGCLGGF